MMKHLQIVAFDNPDPPIYGGVIDVFYKIEALSRHGVLIDLHVFMYNGSQPSARLEALCHRVYYYPRRVGGLSHFSWLPYSVFSRRDKVLLHRLSANPAPILFEGKHTCYYLNHPLLRQHKKYVRMHNIEHHYYLRLAYAEYNLIRRVFFAAEALRMNWFMSQLKGATALLAITEADRDYLLCRLPSVYADYLPCFHPHCEVVGEVGVGDYILYHGNLSVSENDYAACWLVEHLFARLSCRCVIAGAKPSDRLASLVSRYPHIILERSPSQERMEQLVREAHIHLLVTAQATGIKLKLVSAIYSGRHVVVNPMMVNGTRLEELCHVGQDADELLEHCNRLMSMPFTSEERLRRIEYLSESFSNEKNAVALWGYIQG